MATDQNFNNYHHAREVYSLVFLPDKKVCFTIKEMKSYLKFASRKRFGSENSDAHITICEFLATPDQLKIAEKHIRYFCRYFKPFIARFDRTDYFTHKNTYTCFLAPDKKSRMLFEYAMQKINAEFPAADIQKISNPHLTIGRKLDHNQLTIAQKKWDNTEFDMQFICDRIVLRKFNPSIGQFSILTHYGFQQEEEWVLL